MTTWAGVFDAFAWAPLGLWNCRGVAAGKANNPAQEAAVAADDTLHTLRNRSRNPALIAPLHHWIPRQDPMGMAIA